MLNLQYGHVVLHCEVPWLSRGQLWSRFWKLNCTVYNFLEEINELPEETALIRDNNWLFDLAFLTDVTVQLNDLNFKLHSKEKLFATLVNDINTFKMKLKQFISQL